MVQAFGVCENLSVAADTVRAMTVREHLTALIGRACFAILATTGDA